MGEIRNNIWAPWRMEYVQALAEPNAGGCFLCDYWRQPERDDEHHVLWRSERAFVVFNRYPYTNGHLLIATSEHKGELRDLNDAEALELLHLTTDAQYALEQVIHPQGFNVGINFGRCAGAGLPEHLHIHLVPRWSGDTNFMSVVSDVRVILQSIESLHAQLRELSRRQGLPHVRPPVVT